MVSIVTGGAGFIGSNLVNDLINNTDEHVVVIDKLTYAGSKLNLKEILDSPTLSTRLTFYQTDICNQYEVSQILDKHKPTTLYNLAAESHVDNSIDNAAPFVTTNVVGAHALAEAVKSYLNTTANNKIRNDFRFVHISTDEVYGSLEPNTTDIFTEESNYHPNSPYAATKAASDLLLLAYQRTYGLPVIITNCSNNYGPNQFPEKFIPLCILNALEGKPLPIYGDGKQIRDWLHVSDHVTALQLVAKRGKVGQTYCIGGNNELENIFVVNSICDTLTKLKPNVFQPYHELITYVTDRPGHDRRYAIDASKIESELGWHSEYNFDSGLQATVNWYLDNPQWVNAINNRETRERRGLGVTQ